MSIHAGHSPTVSVLMSVYNGEQFLSEAVESILDQTYRDFEFIVVNDGSTDGTQNILESCHDERIVRVNQERTGLTKALNRGLSRARGEYIARMDADDISLPERLERQVAFLDRNPTVALVGCNMVVIDETGATVSVIDVPVENEEIKWQLLFRNRFGHSAVMFRRECLSRVGTYDETIPYAQDYDLWLRISQHYSLGNLREYLHQWRLNARSGISVTKVQEQWQYASRISDRCIHALLHQESVDTVLLAEVRDYINVEVSPQKVEAVEEVLFKILDAFWCSLSGSHHVLKKQRRIMESRYAMNFALLYYQRDTQRDFRRCALRSVRNDWHHLKGSVITLMIKSCVKSLLGERLFEKIRMVKR